MEASEPVVLSDPSVCVVSCLSDGDGDGLHEGIKVAVVREPAGEVGRGQRRWLESPRDREN